MICPKCDKELPDTFIGCHCGWRTLRYRVREWLGTLSSVFYLMAGIIALGFVARVVGYLFNLGWRLF